jgi:hypothetical protein
MVRNPEVLGNLFHDSTFLPPRKLSNPNENTIGSGNNTNTSGISTTNGAAIIIIRGAKESSHDKSTRSSHKVDDPHEYDIVASYSRFYDLLLQVL